MGKVVHVIGNGDGHVHYTPAKGMKLACNLPPREIEDIYASVIVDFKMMAAINEGSVAIKGDWIVGYRPKVWCERHPAFYMKHAAQIKEFYTVLPKYVANYTDFNCGHMAVHYAANKVMADEVNMYGFDSMFDFNLISTTDFVLPSDRTEANNLRLINNWRPVWQNMFKEFPSTKFLIHHKHDKLKFPVPSNVEVVVHR